MGQKANKKSRYHSRSDLCALSKILFFFDRKIHFWKFKKAADTADKIIAISEQTKRDIVEFLKVPESKIEVIYQGCHKAFKEQQSPEMIQETREKFKLPERFILNVGTIEERKNLLNVVKAINGTGIPLVVVGRKTKYYQKIENFLKKNKMQQQVLFLEGVSMDELAAIYKLADIFVYPSFFEGFGIPVIEALFFQYSCRNEQYKLPARSGRKRFSVYQS